MRILVVAMGLLTAVAAAPLGAQTRADWTTRLKSTDLAGIAAQLARPGANWPALDAAPSPLAVQVHQRIKETEGGAAPAPGETGARVRLYADLAKRFRNAGGYANLVLADTLTLLSILHLTQWLAADAVRAAECAALLGALDPPAVDERIFQQAYRAKVGPAVPLPAATPQQLLATLQRLGEGDVMGWPPEDVIFSQGTGMLLTITNPKALLYRVSTTALFGRSALRRWIEFVRSGGTTAELREHRHEQFNRMFPPDYGRPLPETFGPFPLNADAGMIKRLIETANDPNGPYLLWALDGPRRPRQSRFRVTEREIATLSGPRAGFALGVSPDLRRFYVLASAQPDGTGGQTLITERGRSRLYRGITGVVYNRQSSRLAFVGWRDGKSFAIADGVEGEAFDEHYVRDLQFSPDGRHVAYLARRGGEHFIVVDGRPGAPKPDLAALAYAPSGELAWMERRAGLWRMVYQGQESTPYPVVNSPFGITFSPAAGRHWTYQMGEAGGAYVNVVEGLSGVPLAFRSGQLRERPRFSPDGQRVLFESNDETAPQERVRVQIAEVGRPAAAAPQSFTASAAFVNPDLRLVVLANLLGGTNPEGRRTYEMTFGDRRWTVQSVNPPLVEFGPQGRRFIVKGDVLQVDGSAEPGTGPWTKALLSPDERSFAFVRMVRDPAQPARDIVMRDGREVRSFGTGGGEPNHLAFSPDSRHLAFVAPHGPSYVALAVDGEEAPPVYDFIPFHARLVFDAPNRFHTLACRNGKVLQVDVAWTPAAPPAPR